MCHFLSIQKIQEKRLSFNLFNILHYTLNILCLKQLTQSMLIGKSKVLISRVILLLFHLKFWNTGSISIPVRSLLQGRQTSNQGFVKGEELFPFCDLTFSYSFIYRQRTNQLTVIASDWLSNISVWFCLTKWDSEKKVNKWPTKFISFYKSLLFLGVTAQQIGTAAWWYSNKTPIMIFYLKRLKKHMIRF